jgi:putative spermidine/putrescine transport system permease protein
MTEGKGTHQAEANTGAVEVNAAGAIQLRWSAFAIPGMAMLAIVFVVPMCLLVLYSFRRDVGRGRLSTDFTIENYINFLSDPFYYGILLDTFVLAFLVAGICVILGYPVAYFLARLESRWRGLLIFLVASPLLISVVIRNLGWVPILGTNGAINAILRKLGLIGEPLMLMNNFVGVVIGLTHALLPFMILMLMAVIQRIHPSFEDAATNLGASRFYTFRRVTLPLSRRGLFAGFLLVFTVAVSSYTTPAIMGGKRVLIMATLIEQQVRSVLHYAFGGAAAIVLMIVAVALTMGTARWLQRDN